MNRVFMIGWDGATFDLLRPWVEQGKLPNLASLMRRGVHGPLRSTIPPWSFQAWSSFLTGKNPGQHGIYDFFRTPPGTYDLEFVNADHRRGGDTFWEVLSQAGRRVVSISIPGTYPPDPVNGVMISGFDFPGEGPGSFVDAKGMYPPEFHDELLCNVGRHPIDAPILKDLKNGQVHVALDRILETIRQQAATAKYLLTHRPWDCFMTVFGESDGVSHYFWQYCDPTCPFFVEQPSGLADSMLRVYQELDRQMGELLALVPAEANIFVLSDHGSGGVSDAVLFPNRWLQQKGFLHFRGRSTHLLSRVREVLKHWGVAKLPSWLQRLLYRSAWRALGRFEARARYGIIDWSRTTAYFDENPYFPVVRVNAQGTRPHGIVAPGREYEAVRDRLIQELEDWRHPETGQRLVEKAYRREEIYSGACLEEAADVVPKWALDRGHNLGFRLSSKSRDGKWFAKVDTGNPDDPLFPRKFSSHRDHGIFVGQGPDICVGDKVVGARIIDLAPTILALLGVQVPEDMDGRILYEILATVARPPLPERGTMISSLTRQGNAAGAKITKRLHRVYHEL
ncbi:MAG: alkaline phosphatase family protein [Gemmataceae bacterium]|nr:alkaline phosphatase family protein [Gemmataceae bacterium]